MQKPHSQLKVSKISSIAGRQYKEPLQQFLDDNEISADRLVDICTITGSGGETLYILVTYKV